MESLSVETLAAGAKFEPCSQSLFQTNYEAASCNAAHTSPDVLLTPAAIARGILPRVFPQLSFIQGLGARARSSTSRDG
ncbi:hypothetical protein BDZ89DRAFT_1064572 [Hymenopellis radicata]|nr:hypothetical protein BDZ89DRAFT_1064572 [Hymenopellis radicata]